jgi:hypothetical protein
MSTRTELEALMAQVEELWGNLDTLFEIIGENQQWDQPHGQDWTFADVPYHLAYCNRDLVSRPMKLGRDLPVEEQLSFASADDLNEWNERKFAERPAGQTAEESLAELYDSRDEMRQIVSGWTDADLDGPWWMPFMGGMWLEARNALGWTLAHDWSEFMQLRIHMDRSEPAPNPATTNYFLGMVIGGQYPQMLDVEAAQGREFRATMAFTDPGVSSFSIEVVDGQASVRPGEVENPDLVITQSTESFEKTRSGMRPLAQAIQEGEVQVNDMGSLATLGELFPMG